jgi:hypothetical protein
MTAEPSPPVPTQSPVVPDPPGLPETQAAAEGAVWAGLTEPALPTQPESPSQATAEPTASAAAAVPVSGRRFDRARRIGARLRPIFVIALFVGGLAIGIGTFQLTRPQARETAHVQDVAPSADVPPAIQSLAAALRADDRKMLATIVPPKPYGLLAGELARMDMASISYVEILGTYPSQDFTVTQVFIVGADSTGSATATNILVHLQNGHIVDIR